MLRYFRQCVRQLSKTDVLLSQGQLVGLGYVAAVSLQTELRVTRVPDQVVRVETVPGFDCVYIARHLRRRGAIRSFRAYRPPLH